MENFIIAFFITINILLFDFMYINLYLKLFLMLVIISIYLYLRNRNNKFLNYKSIDTIFYMGSLILIIFVFNLTLMYIKSPIKYFIFYIMVFILLQYYNIGNITIGIVHSLSGQLKDNETPLVDILKMEIKYYNFNGGINGKKIKYLIEDGKSNDSDYKIAVEKILSKNIKFLFGCWTSSSRKNILPVLEKYNALLFYPLQYEGNECSKNIIYCGSTPNQQIEVGVNWAVNKLSGNKFFLIGSDYIFPKIANSIIKNMIKNKNLGEIVGEEYVTLGEVINDNIIERILKNDNCIIFNTLNGIETNKSFFEKLYNFYKKLNKNIPLFQNYTVISFSMNEQDIKNINNEYITGQYAIWSYFETINSKENSEFVKKVFKYYGKKESISDPMEATFIGFNLFARAASKSYDMSIETIKNNMMEKDFIAPEGIVILNNNNHLSKNVRIGQINDKNKFNIVYTTIGPIDPRPWNEYISDNVKTFCNHLPGYYTKYKKGKYSIN